MSNSAILEVIIGMIFVYSLVAILVTQINTVIANLLKLRAQHLKHAVQQLVTDPTTQARLLTHPLINLVPRPLDPNREMSEQFAEKVADDSGTTSVSWIAPATFAQVLLDLVAAQSATSNDLYGPLQKIASTVLVGAEKAQIGALLRRVQLTGQGIDDLQAAILNLADPADQQALLQAFDAADAATQQFATDSPALIAVRRGLLNIENPDFKRAIDTILSGVHSIEDAEQRVEQWFNNRMDQATQTYKMRIQYISIAIGLVLVLVLNLDTLQIARTLWNDPALRDTVSVAARASLDSGALQNQINSLNPVTPVPDLNPNATPEPTPSAAEIAATQKQIQDSLQQAQGTVDNLLELRLPIGWGLTPVTSASANALDPFPLEDTRNLWNFWPGNNPLNWLGLLIKKLIGLALTTLAVSQGAPFWFDLLNRIATGKR